MKNIKVTVIGGASSYTPELLEGLIHRHDVLGVKEVVLMDINPERLQIIEALGKRMIHKSGVGINLTTTSNLEDSLRESEFVITQIRVGGMAARIQDERLGLKYGIIGQETTGVGGMAKALRTIPVIKKIADSLSKCSPNAWLINFTNPAGLVTEAVLKSSPVKVIGLCNIPLGQIMKAASFFQVSPQSIYLDSVGLNHLSWVRGLHVEGQKRLADFLDHAIADEFEADRKPAGMAMAHWARFHGMFPSYYLIYYYCTRLVLEDLALRSKTRGEEVEEIEKVLFEKYKNPDLCVKPKELEQRGGAYYSTAAVNLMESLILDRRDVQVVNVRNGNTLPELPSNVCIEVPCQITSEGPVPLPQKKLEPEIRGLIQVVKAYEELTVESAVRGDHRAGQLAMGIHPLIRDIQRIPSLWEELLYTNEAFLPQFRP